MTALRFDTKNNASLIARRTPLAEVNTEHRDGLHPNNPKPDTKSKDYASGDCYLGELHKQLNQLVQSKPGKKTPVMEEEAEDPKSQPMVWVSKWVDYSDKYGIGKLNITNIETPESGVQIDFFK